MKIKRPVGQMSMFTEFGSKKHPPQQLDYQALDKAKELIVEELAPLLSPDVDDEEFPLLPPEPIVKFFRPIVARVGYSISAKQKDQPDDPGMCTYTEAEDHGKALARARDEFPEDEGWHQHEAVRV